MKYKNITLKDNNGNTYYPKTKFENIEDINSKIVTSINNKTGNVKITGENIILNDFNTRSIKDNIDDLISDLKNKSEKNHKHSTKDINETNDKMFVASHQLTNINTIPYLHKNKADKNDVVTSINGEIGDIELDVKKIKFGTQGNTLDDVIFQYNMIISDLLKRIKDIESKI